MQVRIALHRQVAVDGYFGIVDDVSSVVGVDIVQRIEQVATGYLVLQAQVHTRRNLAQVTGIVEMVLQPVDTKA